MTGSSKAAADALVAWRAERAGVDVTGALLPENYTAARDALAALVALDECKGWADRAEALRSYAKQADDPTLLNHAMRVKARAVQRCGELLEGVAPAKNQHDARAREGALPSTREGAAADAGLSEHQRKEALRVAAVPRAQFEAMVESANPPTVTQLANLGRQHRRAARRASAPVAPPEDDPPLTEADALRGVRHTAGVCADRLFNPDGVDAHEWPLLRAAVARLSEAERAALRRAWRFLDKLMEGQDG